MGSLTIQGLEEHAVERNSQLLAALAPLVVHRPTIIAMPRMRHAMDNQGTAIPKVGRVVVLLADYSAVRLTLVEAIVLPRTTGSMVDVDTRPIGNMRSRVEHLLRVAHSEP